MKEGNKKWEEEFRAIFGIKVRPNNQEDETKAFLLEKFWQEHPIGEMVDFISQVEQSAYDKAIEAVRVLIKEDMVGIKNGQYISVEDAEIGEYNQALYVAISEINKLKTNERTNTTN